jgi:hypothetical protein
VSSELQSHRYSLYTLTREAGNVEGTTMSTNAAHREQVKATVEAMIDELGKLRQFMAIDSMPYKLQQVRQLLRELDYELSEAQKRSGEL